METVNQPKKKDGRFYLKKKIAKLQEENATLVKQLHEARDMWSEANAASISRQAELAEVNNALAREIAKSERLAENSVKANEFIGERYVWLYEHAPFWLKWWFKHTFKGAAK